MFPAILYTHYLIVTSSVHKFLLNTVMDHVVSSVSFTYMCLDCRKKSEFTEVSSQRCWGEHANSTQIVTQIIPKLNSNVVCSAIFTDLLINVVNNTITLLKHLKATNEVHCKGIFLMQYLFILLLSRCLMIFFLFMQFREKLLWCQINRDGCVRKDIWWHF